ncbi:MAG: ribosome maturation factor RimM [Rikenellaceae bacterium]
MQSVGRISRLYGTDGEVMLSLYTAFPQLFDSAKPLFIKVDGLWVPLYLDRFERRGRSSANALFADLDSDRRVGEFLSQELFLPESDESAYSDVSEDEFTFDDLVGFRVEATYGDGYLFEGEIVDFYDTARNPLFGVMMDGDEVLIPAAEEFIAGIDFDERRIVFLLPEGLLDL